MKKILLLLSSLPLFSFAQTLTAVANEPKVGDIDLEWRLDSSAYTSGLPVSMTGSNAVWNFTNLATSSLITVTYVSPTTVPSSTAYAGCTVVQKDGTTNTFIKSVSSPSTQTEIVGLDIGLGSVTLTNTAIAARFPMSFGFSLTDNVSGSFTSTITNGTCSGSIVTAVDGLGTLNLPQGLSFTNVLRVKSVLNISLVAGILPLGTAKQTIYNYYHSSQKFPLLNVNYTALSLLTSSSPSVTGVINGNANVLAALRENGNDFQQQVSLFPNPAGDSFRLNLPSGNGEVNIEIFDVTGRLVLSNILNSPADQEILIERLQAGIYSVKVQSGGAFCVKKLIKE